MPKVTYKSYIGGNRWKFSDNIYFKLTGKKLSVAGIALDNATIAQFMNSISASEYFSAATLSSSSQKVIAGAKLKSFS